MKPETASPQQRRRLSSNLTFIDLAPPTESLRDDVLRGLAATPKVLPPKLFYDTEGSDLFEEICAIPEYYLTRTEIGILRRSAGDLARLLGEACLLVEYGCGSAEKVGVLLSAMTRPAGYVAIDISRAALLEGARRLAEAYPEVHIDAVCADYTRQLPLELFAESAAARRVVFFPGSTIGNFLPDEAVAFLAEARRVAGPGGGVIIGTDLQKDRGMLERAYDDAGGVTARFNKNLLTRIEHELGATVDLDGFAHRAWYNEVAGRVEMHLVSRRDQVIRIGAVEVGLREGETIHTENCYKYTVEGFHALAARAGLRPRQVFMDEARWFAVHYLEC